MSKRTLIARVLVGNSGKYLILKRADGASRPGQWEIPGGKVETDEDLEAAAARELEEETGLTNLPLRYETSSSYMVNGEERLGALFTTETSQKVITLSGEHQAYEWVDESNYDNFTFDEHYQRLFNDLFDTDEATESTAENDDKNTSDQETLIIHTDGGSRGNPGPSASGYVITNQDGEVLEEGGEYLGITTNNQAEYQAVKLGLEKAKKYGPVHLKFFIDSLLVVNQMNGIYKIRNRDLWPIHERIKQLASDFPSVTFTHVRREKNKLADAKVNEVLDSHDH